MLNPINTIPIQQFIQQVKIADLSNQKEIKLDIKTAKALSYCLNDLSLRLIENYQEILKEIKNSDTNEPIKIQMDGGGFK